MLDSGVEPQFLQITAILLKKAILKHFQGLEANDAKILRDAILKIYFNCKVKSVKSILSNLIAAIAEYYFKHSEVWPELLNEISQRSEDVKNFESLMDALVLLRELLDGCEDDFKDSFTQITAFLENVLKLNNHEATVEVLKCLSFIVGTLDEDDLIKKHGHLFPLIMKVFAYLLRSSTVSMFQMWRKTCTSSSLISFVSLLATTPRSWMLPNARSS